MTKVAMVSQKYLPFIGGAERQIERLSPLLSERGVEVTVVTRSLPDTPRRERIGALEVVRVPLAPTKPGASLSYTAGGFAEVARLRPDVVHVHGLLSPATIGLLAAATLGVPVVAKVLSSGPRGCLHSLTQRPLGRARVRAIGERFDAVITLAEASDRELAEAGVPPRRLVRIPNGVDTTAFRPASGDEQAEARAELGLPDGPLALYAGRLEAPKRVTRLVEVFAGLPEARLIVVGTGDDEAAVRAVVAESSLEDRVLIRKPLADPAPLYRAADVYVSASEREGMSGSVLEAMASGLPVAAASAPGMTELLADGAGVLVAQEPADALRSAVRELLADPERRARLGATARSRVAENYSLVRTADRLAQLYADVLNGSGPSQNGQGADGR
jgi:glycosyltransferase involved in cell wall biosynthesis